MARKAAAGAGTIRKKTVTRNGKQYTYWEARFTAGRDPGTGKQVQGSITGRTQREVAQRLKEAARAGKLDKNGMELVMQEEKPNQKEVVKLSRERLNKYFPPDMPPQKIEETIVKALDLYYKRLERHRQEQEYTR